MNISRIDNILYNINLYRHHWGFYLSQRHFLKDGAFPRLTTAEKDALKTTWPAMKFRPTDYIWHRIYKKENGFSPYYMSEMQVWYMLEKLNPYDQVVSLQNKALCDVYFPQIPYPEVLVRSIGGILYDRRLNPLSLSQALSVITQEDSFIIKPSVETMQGKGVRKVHVTPSLNEEKLRNLFLATGKDFIVQKTISQHPDLEKFNPTSLNTCRVTSIYINNRFATSTIIKIGKADSIKDNWNSSYIIGIDTEGRFGEYGYDNHLRRVDKSDNGLPFKDGCIPLYKQIISFVENTHKQLFPQCGIIGWDITIDKDNNISVIELNMTCPGLAAEQLASGPFLRPFAEDINMQMKSRKEYHTYRKNIM